MEISWNVLLTPLGSLFPILHLLISLLGCFNTEQPPEGKLQSAIVFLAADGGCKSPHLAALRVSAG